jgi:hypothetical protein
MRTSIASVAPGVYGGGAPVEKMKVKLYILDNLTDTMISGGDGSGKKVTCTYKYSRGANKGKWCGEDVFENTLCKKHAKQQATKDKIQGKSQNDKASETVVKSPKKEASEIVKSKKNEDKASEIVVVVEESQKKEDKASEIVVVVKDEPVVHFDSKLEEIMMHTNKSPSEITKVYEKIIPNQVGAVGGANVKKRRILPPSLRPELKIGDKVVYNDGKKTCKATIKKFIKDMAQLENVTDSSVGDTSLFTGPTRYMIKQK